MSKLFILDAKDLLKDCLVRYTVKIGNGMGTVLSYTDKETVTVVAQLLKKHAQQYETIRRLRNKVNNKRATIIALQSRNTAVKRTPNGILQSKLRRITRITQEPDE